MIRAGQHAGAVVAKLGRVRELPVMVRVPGADWMDSAVRDLADAGCSAVAIGGPDGEGCWTLAVRGPRLELATLRHAVSGHQADFCWEAFLSSS